MKTILHFKKFNFLIKAFSLITALVASANMYAAVPGDSAENPLVLENGQTYEVSKSLSMKSLYATYTATESGIMSLVLDRQEPMQLYTDNTYTTLAEIQPEWNNEYSPRVYDLEVESGKTYYFYAKWCMNIGTISVKFGTQKDLELVESVPADNEVLKASNNIDLVFNKQIAYSKITLTTGGKTLDVTNNAKVSGVHCYIDVSETLMQLYRNGELSEGDAIVLTAENVTLKNDESVKYGDEGKLVLNFTAGKKPIELIGANNVPGGTPDNRETFYSYYMKNDENAIATFTFDGKIDQNKAPKAMLVYGQRGEGEAADYAEIALPVKFENDNTVSVDFSGSARRPQDMVPGGSKFDTIALVLNNVMSEDGQYAYSTGAGSLGSFAYQFNYEIVKYDLVTEFYPQTKPGNPTVIDGIKEIELLYSESGNNKMVYSGAVFTYTEGGKKATTNVEVSAEADPDDAEITVITIPVPEMNADAGTDVTVALANVETPDGLDYSKDLSAVYVKSGEKPEVLTMTTDPAEGATVESIKTVKFMCESGIAQNTACEGKIVISNRFQEVMATAVSFENTSKTECVVTFDNEINSNGFYMMFVPENSFLLGSESKPSEEAQIMFTVESNKTSSEKVELDPTPGQVESLKEIKLTFVDEEEVMWGDGSPSITDAAGTSYSFEARFDWDDDYNQLRITLDEEITADGTYTLTLPAGCVFLGPDGIPSTLTQEFVYTIGASADQITLDPAPGNVESLKEIKLTFVNEEEVMWGDGMPSITDAAGTSYSFEARFDWDDDYNQLRITLDEEITAEGTYTLTLPAGCVFLGADGVPSTETFEFVYIIGQGSVESILGVNGESDVYSINGTLVLKGAKAEDFKMLNKGIYIVAGKKIVIR